MGIFSKAEFTCDACEVHATGLRSFEAHRLAELHLHPAIDPASEPEPARLEGSGMETNPTDRKED